MKPQLQPRFIHLLRHAPYFCVAPASSQVFSLTARAVPTALLPQEPHTTSDPTILSRRNTCLLPSSSHSSTIQIP